MFGSGVTGASGAAVVSPRKGAFRWLSGMRVEARGGIRRLALLLALCGLMWGCAQNRPVVQPERPAPVLGWTERSISSEEIEELCGREPELTPRACMEILARLNLKDRAYIKQDVKSGKTLKVPNDFRAYFTWTPLPRKLDEVEGAGKFILVVRDIPFIGWYADGNLAGDSHICVGKKRDWTKIGFYRVLEKDIDHVSASYKNAFGTAALMPYAIRIYGRVWIHGGDVVNGYCSHGCINLPLSAAEELFQWTDAGTPVLVVESLKDLDRTLEKHSRVLTARR
ncbi:MAG: L,D-transpeptidase, partial [Syntrophobacteraceae bacterium]